MDAGGYQRIDNLGQSSLVVRSVSLSFDHVALAAPKAWLFHLVAASFLYCLSLSAERAVEHAANGCSAILLTRQGFECSGDAAP